jgi:disulfide bond formation protein DsbB
MNFFARLRPIWPILTLLGSGALLAGAHTFERFGGLAPCPLCLDQRKWHWAVVGVSFVLFIVLRVSPKWARWGGIVIGLVLLGAMGMALYHVAVEQGWVIAQCDARIDFDDLAFDPNAEITIPKCDEIAWSMWGVSMAGWNALISGAMAVASFVVALWPEARK